MCDPVDPAEYALSEPEGGGSPDVPAGDRAETSCSDSNLVESSYIADEAISNYNAAPKGSPKISSSPSQHCGTEEQPPDAQTCCVSSLEDQHIGDCVESSQRVEIISLLSDSSTVKVRAHCLSDESRVIEMEVDTFASLEDLTNKILDALSIYNAIETTLEMRSLEEGSDWMQLTTPLALKQGSEVRLIITKEGKFDDVIVENVGLKRKPHEMLTMLDKEAVDKLKRVFLFARRVRGDGNCFYRAVMFKIIESVFERFASKPSKENEMIVHACRDKLCSGSNLNDEDRRGIHALFAEIREEADDVEFVILPGLTLRALLNAHPKIDDLLIRAARGLIADYLRAASEAEQRMNPGPTSPNHITAIIHSPIPASEVCANQAESTEGEDTRDTSAAPSHGDQPAESSETFQSATNSAAASSSSSSSSSSLSPPPSSITIAEVILANFDQTVEDFIDQVVLMPGRDAEDVIVTFASRALESKIRIWQLDTSTLTLLKCLAGRDDEISVTGQNALNVGIPADHATAAKQGQCYSDVHLLLRKGHYDLLYYNKKLRRGRPYVPTEEIEVQLLEVATEFNNDTVEAPRPREIHRRDEVAKDRRLETNIGTVHQLDNEDSQRPPSSGAINGVDGCLIDDNGDEELLTSISQSLELMSDDHRSLLVMDVEDLELLCRERALSRRLQFKHLERSEDWMWIRDVDVIQMISEFWHKAKNDPAKISTLHNYLSNIMRALGNETSLRPLPPSKRQRLKECIQDTHSIIKEVESPPPNRRSVGTSVFDLSHSDDE